MTRITKIATWKREEQGPAILIEADGKRIEIGHSELTTLNTEAKIKMALETRFKESLPDVYIHKNRDGTLSAAVGAPPKIWPEDVKD